jgi:hypothetical protein
MSNYAKIPVIVLAVISMMSCVTKSTTVHNSKSMVIDAGTYDTQVDIIVTDDVEEAFQFVIEHVDSPVDTADFEADGVTFTDEEGRIVIWISDAENQGVVSHELLHATLSIMTWAGVYLNDTTEEAYTYELQYLTNQFYNKLKQ